MSRIHTDHLGSTVTTTSGTTPTQERYHAYGARRSTTAITATDYEYTGQYSDTVTGLIYMNARYYDPTIGQFISPDTIVPDPSNLFDYNRYMYTRGNPLKYSDPSGHVPQAQEYDQYGGGGHGLPQAGGSVSARSFTEADLVQIHEHLSGWGFLFPGADLIDGMLYTAEGD